MLLTRLPRYRGLPPFAFDLHVLGTPPAFVLSQDQTLQDLTLSDLTGIKVSAELAFHVHPTLQLVSSALKPEGNKDSDT